MNNLSQERRALFQRARQDFEPTGNERERNARALAARLGISAGALASTLSSAPASAAGASIAAAGKSGASLALLTSKWLVVGLLLGGGVLAGVVAEQGGSASASLAGAIPSAPRSPTRRPTLRSLEAHSAPAVEVPAATTPAPVIRLAPVRPAELPGNPDPKAPNTPVVHAANVTEEARLVRRAEEALGTGSPSAALTLLDQLAREQPNGVLMEERSVERIDGLCQLGRTVQAHAEATRFLQATPSSPLANRVRRSCAGPLTTPTDDFMMGRRGLGNGTCAESVWLRKDLE